MTTKQIVCSLCGEPIKNLYPEAIKRFGEPGAKIPELICNDCYNADDGGTVDEYGFEKD